MERVYVDTCIFMDALLDRKNKSGRDIGTPAMSFFSRASGCEFRIIISDWTLEELYRNLDEKRLKEFLSDIEHKVERCGYNEEDIKKAREKSGHWQDFLHGILAEKSDADYIATRNIEDFRILSAVQPKLPGHF